MRRYPTRGRSCASVRRRSTGRWSFALLGLFRLCVGRKKSGTRQARRSLTANGPWSTATICFLSGVTTSARGTSPHGVVERQIGHRRLETLVFGFQLAGLAGFIFGHTAVLGFPSGDGRHRDSLESRQTTDRGSGLKLPEGLQELLRVSSAPHVLPSLLLALQSNWHRNQGRGQRPDRAGTWQQAVPARSGAATPKCGWQPPGRAVRWCMLSRPR